MHFDTQTVINLDTAMECAVRVYSSAWNETIANTTKLRTYCLYKHIFTSEHYVNLNRNYDICSCLSQSEDINSCFNEDHKYFNHGRYSNPSNAYLQHEKLDLLLEKSWYM